MARGCCLVGGMAWREGMVWGVDELAAGCGNGVLGMAWIEGLVWDAETLFAGKSSSVATRC